jgi:hypothetical protein
MMYLESDNMKYLLAEKEQLKMLCAKSVSMTLGGNLHRD